MKAAIIGTVLLLGGCANTDMKASIVGANVEIAKAKAIAMEKPLVDIKIPIPSCVERDGKQCVMSVVVRQQTGSGSGDYVAAPDDPWARVAERLVGGLVTASGIYLGGQAAANIVTDTSVGIVNALKTQAAPTVINQPPPVIVPPADPVIVTQPPPVIIEQPAPIIIPAP